jgi:hypothetical protein
LFRLQGLYRFLGSLVCPLSLVRRPRSLVHPPRLCLVLLCLVRLVLGPPLLALLEARALALRLSS